MKSITIVSIAVVLAALFVPALFMEDAEAVSDGSVYYCYGDNPILSYDQTMRPSVTIQWSAVDQSGNVLECIPSEGESTSVDLSGVPYGSWVTVTQDVYSDGQFADSATVTLIPLHIGYDEYTVTFMDGSRVLDTQTISHTTLVMEGDDHVIVPASPVKEGYTFGGWYVDQQMREEFDPKQPVTGDMTIYAKWLGSGSGSNSSTVIVDRTCVVTFNCVAGLEYQIVGQTSNSVSFTVGIVGGFEVDGNVSVTSDYGVLDLSQGVYTLSDISRNIIVTIDGDVFPIHSDAPDDDAGGFPWIYVIIAIIVIVVLAILAYHYHNRRD